MKLWHVLSELLRDLLANKTVLEFIFMKTTGFIIAALSLLTVSACSSLSKSQCQSRDWHGIGLSDGTAGAALSKLSQHRNACSEHGVQIDGNMWRQGRVEGLKIYCRPLNGYQLGRNGKLYHNVCPDNMVAQFNRAYHYGEKIHQLSLNLAEMEQQLTTEEAAVLNEALSKDERRHHLHTLKQLEVDIDRTIVMIHSMERNNPYLK